MPDFQPKVWANTPSGNTPIAAEELNRIEGGVFSRGDVKRVVANSTKVYPARPSTSLTSYIEWIGENEPTAAEINDTWFDLTNNIYRLRMSSSAWAPTLSSGGSGGAGGGDGNTGVINSDGNMLSVAQYDGGADITQYNVVSTGVSISSTDAWAAVGVSSIRVDITSSSLVKTGSGLKPSGLVTVKPNTQYTVKATVNNQTVVVPFVLQINWRDANNAGISTSKSTAKTLSFNAPEDLTVNATSPSTAGFAYMQLLWDATTPVGGDYYYTDAWEFKLTPIDAPTTPVVNPDKGANQPASAYTSTTRNPYLWPFSETSVWNLGIATAATFTDGTDAATLEFRNPDGGVWINQGQYSHPIYYARTTDTTVLWTDKGTAGRSGVFRAAPGEVRANGTDKHMHTMSPYGRFVDEMIGVNPADSVNPGLGGTCSRHQRVDMYGDGRGPQNGVRAYGGSAIGGLIRSWEIDKTHPSYDGEIHHPLAFALSAVNQYYSGGAGGYDSSGNGSSKGYVWPATEQDYAASSIYKGNIPMGALFAIPSTVDVTTLGLSSDWALMLARACQKYGAYNTDTSTLLTFYVEPSAPGDFRSALIANGQSDLIKIINAMSRVTNSAVDTPGGAAIGAPRLVPTVKPLATQATVTPLSPNGSIRFVGSTAASTTFQQTMSFAVPAGTQTGDFLVMCVTAGNDKTITQPSDWTRVGGTAAGTRRQYMFTKFVAAGDTSYSFSNSAANNGWSGILHVYRGVNTTTPVGEVQTRASTSALRSWSFGLVTPEQKGEVILQSSGWDRTSTTIYDENAVTVQGGGTVTSAHKWVNATTATGISLNITGTPSIGAGLILRIKPATPAPLSALSGYSKSDRPSASKL